MEYIINPMWFYWIGVSNTLKSLCELVCVILIMGIIIVAIDPSIDKSKEFAMWKKLIVGVIITALLSVFIPNKETLVKMQIAKLGTKGNVEVVLQTIDDKTDKLIEVIGKR